MALRILLLQAREADDPMRAEELLSFAEKSELAPEQFTPHDLLAGPPALGHILSFDAMMIGGSGDYYVSKRNLPGFDELLETLAGAVDAGHPTFASCFGFQLLTVALGGEIVHDPESSEVGTYELSLTAAGRDDDLLGWLPPAFFAQLGRKDRAARLPATVSNLASSEANPHQAFRVPGQPVWGTQFHPELDRESNLRRFHRYADSYCLNPDERDEALARYQESPATHGLLPAFLRLVFGDRAAARATFSKKKDEP
ncbi:MAG: type 1 glutamine amidotransferase [Planctomycetota bacterium]|nr:type 1 glutamine amidotransferase [Planctomycetota bacterium]